MAGRAKTRAKLTAQLEAAGLPPPARGKPITDLKKQAAALAAMAIDAEKKKLAAAAARKKATAKKKAERKAAGVAPSSHNDKGRKAGDAVELTTEDIKGVLREILLNPCEPGAARISAADKLLQMDGTAPQYQKAIIEVHLTAYQPNQYELDKKARSR